MLETRTGAEDSESARDVADETTAALLPWCVSVLLHAGVVAIVIFAVWATAEETDEREEPIIAELRWSERPQALEHSSSRSQSLASNHGRSASERDAEHRASQGGLQLGFGPASESANGGGGQSGDPGDGKKFPGMSGQLTRAAPLPGSGRHSSLSTGIFREPGGNVRRVVYVIDASGSLIDSLMFVLGELRRSIASLEEFQQFTVIFFQGGRVIEPPLAGLRPATHENKRAIIDWLDPKAGNVVAKGSTDPVVAVVRALGYKPDLIFLLSDDIIGRGRHQVDRKSLLAAIEAANARPTKINTIQFLTEDPLAGRGRPSAMRLIADATRGEYRFVSRREIGIE